MATNLLSQSTTYCTNHRGIATTMRCDQCGKPFCRDCLTSRWITSRSSVWLCRRCAGGSSLTSAWGRSSSGGLLDLVARYWWLLAAIAVVAWVVASR
jgi:hypothetical protein